MKDTSLWTKIKERLHISTKQDKQTTLEMDVCRFFSYKLGPVIKQKIAEIENCKHEVSYNEASVLFRSVRETLQGKENELGLNFRNDIWANIIGECYELCLNAFNAFKDIWK